jgi:EmrB/QacA subfamily drug resistance transporter
MTIDDSVAHERRWWTLGVLCLSLLIVFGGNASLNVAIPTLSRELDATTSQLQWIVAVYSLVFAGLLFTSGALGDRFGRKGALQLGLLIYLVAAGLATLSGETWQLIACRGVMGVGAALIMPSTLSILINVFPPDERTKAIAIWAGFTGAVGAVGPPVSGLLLGHFWYGSVFLINVPIIAVAFLAGHYLVPSSRDPRRAPLDPLGAVLSIVGIVALVYGLIEAPDKGWGSGTTLVSFGVALAVLVLFVAWELRADEPMLDIRLFRVPAFSVGSGGMMLVFLGMYGLMFLLTQYFQLVRGYSALQAAMSILPTTPIMFVVAPATPRLSVRFGAHRVVAAGMLCAAVGLVLFTQIEGSTPYLVVLAALCVFATGLALTMSPMTASIMSAVPARRAGAGSAMNDTTRELGSALGVAVLGSIAASRYAARVGDLIAQLPAGSRGEADSSLAGALTVAARLPRQSALTLQAGARAAFIDGLHLACLSGVGLALVAAVLVFRYLPHTVSTTHPTEVDEPDAPEPAAA